MPFTGAGSTNEKHRALIAAVLAGRPDATAAFVRDISGAVWASCRALTAYDGEARDRFIEIFALLRTSGFAAFRGYDGRSSLNTFAALVVRELHGNRLLELLNHDHTKAWRMFGQLFDDDIRRLIARCAPRNRAGTFTRRSVSR